MDEFRHACSVHSYGFGHVHLGMLKVIPIIKSVTELSHDADFLHVICFEKGRSLKSIKKEALLSSVLPNWLLMTSVSQNRGVLGNSAVSWPIY